ncbi:DUF1853 family protein [Pontimicrobium sp. SW4]|uniref:DUF1853 family protein n=1 Tax=Pontimicrobium sp. SW4 TaxID=3153519 RepID=A0AAU7BWL1_9FLAO
MTLTTKQIQQHFDGFLQTPSLWENSAIYNLHQFSIPQKSLQINSQIDTKLRLGKYIERFVSFQLQQEKTTHLLAENIQIKRDNVTLGEIDCLLVKDKKPLHLEVIYKFYLYDVSVGNTEIEHFIGPNRKDTLVEKLNKLRQKQLPLLYSKECQSYLKTLDLNALEIEQQVYFKAQLFVPYSKKEMQLETLNQECISGFYIYKYEIEQFTTYKFYIPTKKDWLIVPHPNVNWVNFNVFEHEINIYFIREFSPMVWVKHPSGDIEKLFFVWW